MTPAEIKAAAEHMRTAWQGSAYAGGVALALIAALADRLAAAESRIQELETQADPDRSYRERYRGTGGRT